MDYRRFGKTNLRLSTFSLGTMRCLASPGQLYGTVSAAIALGINHIETARSYGASEVYLGRAFQGGIPREQLYLTTKVLPRGDGAAVERAVDESLERLQTDYLDMVAIHGMNTPEHLAWALDDNGGWRGLQRAIADGRVRHLGFSSHGSLEILTAAIGSDRFEFINLHYNYFFQRNAPAIALAHRKDMGIFIISPADKGGKLYTPPEKLRRLCAPLTPLQWGYRFLLADPRITTLSMGPANPTELAPLRDVEHHAGLADHERAILQRLDAGLLNDSQGMDRCSQCYGCLPCPESIPIPEILRLRNLDAAYDMGDYGKYRYGMLENAGHWFPGRRGDRCTDCGDCLPRCPEQLDIPTLLRDSHDRFGQSFGRRLWED